MISYEEALALMLPQVSLKDAQELPLAACLHRVLAEDVTALLTHPPHDASMMDGYALRYSAERLPLKRTIVGDVRAGASFSAGIDERTCVRIYTGGFIPPGADAVIPLEAAREEGSEVVLTPAASYWRKGCFIRRGGQDFKAREVLLRRGTLLRPRHLGLAAAAGRGVLLVRHKPKVACLATGDELVPLEEAEKKSSCITASSLHGLLALIEAQGGAGMDYGIAADDEAKLLARLETMAHDADLVVTTGGVSKGAYDAMAQIARRHGCLFNALAVRPGKPVTLTLFNGTPILSLAGNPVSALVAGHVLLAPLLRRMLGREGLLWRAGRLGRRLKGNGARLSFERGRLIFGKDGTNWVFPYKSQDSAMMRLFARADVLLMRKPNAPPQGRGDGIRFLSLDD